MEIQFDMTADELIEHHFRLFIRSRTYKMNRWVGVAGSFLGVGVVFLILGNSTRAELPPWFPLLLAGLVAGFYLFFYPDISPDNIRKYLLRKLAGQFPCPNRCTVREGRLVCNLLGKEVAFEVSELVSLEEDENLLELYFGGK